MEYRRKKGERRGRVCVRGCYNQVPRAGVRLCGRTQGCNSQEVVPGNSGDGSDGEASVSASSHGENSSGDELLIQDQSHGKAGMSNRDDVSDMITGDVKPSNLDLVSHDPEVSLLEVQ